MTDREPDEPPAYLAVHGMLMLIRWRCVLVPEGDHLSISPDEEAWLARELGGDR